MSKCVETSGREWAPVIKKEEKLKKRKRKKEYEKCNKSEKRGWPPSHSGDVEVKTRKRRRERRGDILYKSSENIQININE